MKLQSTKGKPSIQEQVKQMGLYKPVRASVPNASVTSSPERSGMLYLPKHARETLFLLRIDRLHPYAANPFKPYSEEKMAALMESIRRDGLQHPIIVRDYRDTDEYKILSGHNRVEAMRRLGEEEIPAVCRNMDDDKAALVVVAANFEQREKLLPSEKAFAYRLQIDALQRQKTQIHNANMSSNSNELEVVAQIEQPGISREIVACANSVDRNEIQRYIRLTYLISELLDMVDEERLAVMAGYELSFLDPMVQEAVLTYLVQFNKKLSVKDAAAVRAACDAGKPVTVEAIPTILTKPQKKAKGVTLSERLLKRYAIPDGIDVAAVVCGMLEERFGRR